LSTNQHIFLQAQMVEKQPAFVKIILYISVLLCHITFCCFHLLVPQIFTYKVQCLIFKTDRISILFRDFVCVTFQVMRTLFIMCSHSWNENYRHFILVFVEMAMLIACPVINGSTGQTQHTRARAHTHTHTHTHTAHNILQITEMQVCHDVICQTHTSSCILPVQHDTASYCEKRKLHVEIESTEVGMWQFTTTHSID
jgi:hypothetical protein